MSDSESDSFGTETSSGSTQTVPSSQMSHQTLPSIPPTPPIPQHLLDADSPAIGRAQSPTPPQQVPVFTGFGGRRGRARISTGPVPRGPLAPRDVPHSIHEEGESSQQAEMRVQLQRVTLDLQLSRVSLQETRDTLWETRTAYESLAEHVAVLEAGARAWREVIEGRLQWTLGGMCRSGVERVRGWMVGLGNMRMELRLLDAAIVMAAVAIIITCLLYLLR